MADEREIRITRLLQPILDRHEVGEVIGDDEIQGFLNALEWGGLLEGVLRGVHREWQYQCFDGLLPAMARKIGPHEVDILGVAFHLPSGGSATFRVNLQISASGNEIGWLECGIGEIGELRNSHGGSHLTKRLLLLPQRVDSIHWDYRVGLGERQAGSV